MVDGRAETGVDARAKAGAEAGGRGANAGAPSSTPVGAFRGLKGARSGLRLPRQARLDLIG